MELKPYSDEDLGLSEALELDPETMRNLGGASDPDDVRKVHPRRVELAASGGFYFVIVPEPSSPPVGTIGIWDTSFRGSPIHEVGWMVLPEFQGRGIASEALGLLIARARSDSRFERIHAFPGVANVPSNALCRRFGFTHTEKTEVRFRERPLRINHWELHVSN